MDDATSLYGSASWVAGCFGKSKSWLWTHRERLEAEGFPKRDRLTGTWIKADVLEFISRQRQLGTRATVAIDQDAEGGKIDYGKA